MALYTIPKLPPNPQSATAKFHPQKTLPLTSQLLHHLVFICHVSHDCATCRTAVQGRFSEDKDELKQKECKPAQPAREFLAGKIDVAERYPERKEGKAEASSQKRKRRNNNNLQALLFDSSQPMDQPPHCPWFAAGATARSAGQRAA